MAVLGLQGVRGGVGTTSVTAALAWSLQVLGESVLVIDACSDNLLRMSFNVDFTYLNGWGRALLDDKDWRDAGLRYTSQLDLLPFGQLTETERGNEAAFQRLFSRFTTALQSLKEKGHYRWILLDLPHGAASLTRQLLAQCDHVLSIAKRRCELPYPSASAGVACQCPYSDQRSAHWQPDPGRSVPGLATESAPPVADGDPS